MVFFPRLIRQLAHQDSHISRVIDSAFRHPFCIAPARVDRTNERQAHSMRNTENTSHHAEPKSESSTSTNSSSSHQLRHQRDRTADQPARVHRRIRPSVFDPFFDSHVNLFSPIATLSPFGHFGSFGVNPSVPEMTVDMYSTKDAYHISAAVPGVNKEDIHVRVDDGVLFIQAERKVERRSAKPQQDSQPNSQPTSAESNSANATAPGHPNSEAATKSEKEVSPNNRDKPGDIEYHFMESSYGLVERSVTLPEDVDIEKLSAKYENGVLKLELKRLVAQKSNQRTVAIE